MGLQEALEWWEYWHYTKDDHRKAKEPKCPFCYPELLEEI